jgi:hypothetical protein
MTKLENLLTLLDVVKITRLSKRKIQEDVSSGSITHMRFGRALRFYPVDVSDYIIKHRIQKRGNRG